jgi:hypothetical protein
MKAAGPQRRQQYEDVRDQVILSTAIACAWRSTGFVNNLLEDEFVDLPTQYKKDCVAFEHWAHWLQLMEGTFSSARLPSDLRSPVFVTATDYV